MPPFLGSKYRIFWGKSETVDSVDDIEHAGVRGCLKYLNIEDGIEVHHAGDLPARSGLGSSSAFTVGMLHALHALNGKQPGRASLADQAITVEQKILRETVGIQDQIECAWGGMNIVDIEPNGCYRVQPLLISNGMINHIQDHLVLVFTNLQRHASEVAKAQIDRMNQNQNKMHEIVNLVYPAAEALMNGNMQQFGALLHHVWMLKRELSDKVTNKDIDEIYEIAMDAGAYGGKLLGAGSGGFMLFCLPPEKRQMVLQAVGLLSIPIQFEHSGSQLVLAEK